MRRNDKKKMVRREERVGKDGGTCCNGSRDDRLH